MLGELGKLGGLGAVLGEELGEPALDGLPEFAGGIGIAATGLGFEFGDQGALAPFDITDLLAQLAGALGGAVW